MKNAECEYKDLLPRIAQGDVEAFAAFYDQTVNDLYSLVCIILGNEKEAEYVLQEGFMQIWKKAATYDVGQSSAFTWAVMIMRHKAFDHVRSYRHRGRLIDEAM